MRARSSRLSAGMPSQRQLKVGEQVRHVIAESLTRGELHDSRLIDASLTVLEVKMTADLRHATVFLSQLGQDRVDDEVMAALERLAGVLAGRIARQTNLKYAPRIRFEADDTMERVNRIEQLLDQGLGREKRER